MNIPKKLEALAPYDAQSGAPAVKLDANESFLPLPGELLEKIQAEIAGVAFHRYPDPGAQQVCAAAAELFGVEPAQVVAGNGSDELISVLFTCFLDKGSKVLICDPDFSMYRFYGAMAEMEIVDAGRRGGAPDPEEIVRCAQKYDVSAVIFSNPCNPTGKGLHREAVLELIRSLPEVLIVVDEAYMDFWDQSIGRGCAPPFPTRSCFAPAPRPLGLRGIRLGLAIGGEAMIDLVKKAKSPYNVNALTQAAAPLPSCARRNISGARPSRL